MFSLDDLKEETEKIQKKLGVEFKDRSLLFLAFVHSSYVNENKKLVQEHNERLEFLGDAVLELLISDFLYREFPNVSEGELTLMRSSLVDSAACIHFVQKLGLEQYVLLGKGEKLLERGRETILSDLFEALIAAIYLDSGWETAKAFLFDNFAGEIKQILQKPQENFKAELQAYTQKQFSKTPHYKILEESGPDHNKHFIIGVFLAEKKLASGEGSNKKDAEQMAAQKALEKIKSS